MLLRACRARLTDHPHPAVGLGMFEVVVRYWEFFRLCPECLGGVLEGFLGRRFVLFFLFLENEF